MTGRSMIAMAVLALASVQAQATLFKPTGAVASSAFNATSYGAVNTINGSGLSGGGLDTSAAHAAYASGSGGNHWTTAAGTQPATQWIDWTFSTPVTMGAAWIWNHQSNGGLASNGGYDVTLFDLTLFDASDTILLSLDNQALLPDTAFAQRIDFGLTSNVSRVRFDIEAVQSSTSYTGLAEVAFDSQSYLPGTGAVPEPASWLMLITGFGFTGAALRRRAARAVRMAA